MAAAIMVRHCPQNAGPAAMPSARKLADSATVSKTQTRTGQNGTGSNEIIRQLLQTADLSSGVIEVMPAHGMIAPTSSTKHAFSNGNNFAVNGVAIHFQLI